ncbi:WRKY transcription factor [Sarracenia purpurea var. burkii]
MARNWEEEQKVLIYELNQGRELTKQLKTHLQLLSSPDQSCDLLIQKIISSHEKALSLLNWGTSIEDFHPQPQSLSSCREFKGQSHKNVDKNRKTWPRWRRQVKVCSGTGVGALDDGCSWRKYGQKDILGANFPRSYYRCTHRHVQGCLATKQVQRSDEDPSIVEITYRGRHTCIQSSPQANPDYDPTRKDDSERIEDQRPHQEDETQIQYLEKTGIDFGTGLEVKTGNPFDFPSFSFSKQKNLSSETSKSSYFLPVAFQMDDFGLSGNLQCFESDPNEIVSVLTSTSFFDSPIANLDFSLDPDGIDNIVADLTFDASNISS